MAILQEISVFLQKGRSQNVKELISKALRQGIGPQEILNQGLLPGMSIIGEKFKNNEVFVPEVLVAARAMNAGTASLKHHLVQAGVTTKGVAVIGTIKGDLHDIGKNLVRMMIESKGIKVIDLGVDVSAERFVQAAIDNHAQVICCSALLTTTMTEMKNVIEEAVERGVRDQVKIMVGGAPLNQEFCDTIQADCYTEDATAAAIAAWGYVS